MGFGNGTGSSFAGVWILVDNVSTDAPYFQRSLPWMVNKRNCGRSQVWLTRTKLAKHRWSQADGVTTLPPNMGQESVTDNDGRREWNQTNLPLGVSCSYFARVHCMAERSKLSAKDARSTSLIVTRITQTASLGVRCKPQFKITAVVATSSDGVGCEVAKVFVDQYWNTKIVRRQGGRPALEATGEVSRRPFFRSKGC